MPIMTTEKWRGQEARTVLPLKVVEEGPAKVALDIHAVLFLGIDHVLDVLLRSSARAVSLCHQRQA